MDMSIYNKSCYNVMYSKTQIICYHVLYDVCLISSSKFRLYLNIFELYSKIRFHNLLLNLLLKSKSNL